MGLLNTEGYYDGLVAFARHSVAQGFLSDAQLDLIRIDTDPARLLTTLVEAAGFAPPARVGGI